MQNQRQKARKQTAAGTEHAYSAELSQRGRPTTQDGGESTSSSRPGSRGSDALGLNLEGRQGSEQVGSNRVGLQDMVAHPALPQKRAEGCEFSSSDLFGSCSRH